MRLTAFEIHNFRTFQRLRLDGLERVNLIAGQNNVGKTALLEALWQFTGPDQPDVGLRLNQFRGIQWIDQSELLFDLFHEYDVLEPIKLVAEGTWPGGSRSLQITAQLREGSRIAIQGNGQRGEQMVPVAESPFEIVLRYQDGADTYESSGWHTARTVGPGIIQSDFETLRQRVPGRPSGHYFSPRHRNSPQEEANTLGRLEVKGSANLVVDAIRLFEPRLRRITTIAIEGAPVIHADLGSGRLMPMGLLGDGVQRVLSLALVFEKASGGWVFVDEIENGIHYSKLADLWQIISSFSVRFDVQVFATTHSNECVRAAHKVFVDTEVYLFRFFRLDRIKDTIAIKAFDKTTLATAIEVGLEVR